MEHCKPWVTLGHLVGRRMPIELILDKIRKFDRREGLFTLCRMAADLANDEGGITGTVARSWSHDLLTQRVGSADSLEDAVSRATAQLGPDTAIIHGHALFLLQYLILVHGTNDGRRPHDGELAFLMLALGDHIPTWPEPSPELSKTEEMLGILRFSTIFNETSDDPLRFMLRITEIVGGNVQGSPIDAGNWERIQIEAFGCSFAEYAERFLVPLFLRSKNWGQNDVPMLSPADWGKGHAGELYLRWFREASTTLDEAASWALSAKVPLGLPGVFFRTPFVRVDDNVLCFSPWHIKDYAYLGTWAKLNAASKKVFGTTSSQRFASTFGYLFERWCASLAREAACRHVFKGKLLLPSSPGARDEIEDIVIVDRGRVALFSAKSSLVPESSLKSAASIASIVTWLRRFFFEDASSAKATGYRAGALWLLDRKVQEIRAGAYEDRGISKDALVIPVVVSFDKLGESGVLYNWIEDECTRLGILSSRPLVRPLTILTPEDFEAILALGCWGKSTCDLLVEKTRPTEKFARMDWFLERNNKDGRSLRLSGIEMRFKALIERSVQRLRDAGVVEG